MPAWFWFEFGFVLGMLITALIAWKVGRWFLSWQIRGDDIKKAKQGHRDRKKRYLKK